MGLVLLENCSYKKSVLLFFQLALINISMSKQHIVLNPIRFLLSSLKANMATISINFQQKFALVRSF